MSKFFIGVRVKKVRGLKEAMGLTGVVVALFGPSWRPDLNCQIKVDNEALTLMGDFFPAGTVVGCLLEEWEPILPDGHRAAEESLEELLPFLKEQKVSA